MAGGDQDGESGRRPRQWTADAPTAPSTGAPRAAVPGKRNLIHETFGPLMRVAAAPVQRSPKAHNAPMPSVAMTVTVHYRGKKPFVWHGASSTPGAAGTYTAHRAGGSWQWDNPDGETIRIYKDESDHTGRPISSYMSDPAAYEVVVTFGEGATEANSAGTSTDSGGSNPDRDATSSVGDDGSSKASSSSSSTPSSSSTSSDVATSGDWTDLPGAREAQDALNRGGQGRGDNANDVATTPTQDAKRGDTVRDGAAPDLDDDGEQIADDFEAQLDGIIGGTAGGKGSQLGGQPDGRSGDDTDPQGTGYGGDQAQLGGDDDADGGGSTEKDGGVKSDTAEQGGRKHGDERGEYDGDGRQGDAGVRGAVALFGGLINVPDALRGAVELGILINQGDVAGLGADFFKAGGKKFASAAAARVAMAKEARAVAKREAENALGKLAKEGAYQALSTVEKKQVARIIYWQYQRDFFEGALRAAREQKEAVALIKKASKGAITQEETAKLAAHLAKDDPEMAAIAGRAARGDVTAADAAKLEGKEARAAQMEQAAEVQPVAGRLPANHEFAGKDFPLPEETVAKLRSEGIEATSVHFSEAGFPDFEPFAKELPNGERSVTIELTGSRAADARAANRAAGLKREPRGYVWHHSEEMGTMILVPESVHEAVRHTGGAAVYKQTHGTVSYGK